MGIHKLKFMNPKPQKVLNWGPRAWHRFGLKYVLDNQDPAKKAMLDVLEVSCFRVLYGIRVP